jgi:hypothetical protein
MIFIVMLSVKHPVIDGVIRGKEIQAHLDECESEVESLLLSMTIAIWGIYSRA